MNYKEFLSSGFSGAETKRLFDGIYDRGVLKKEDEG